jgi:hypothetical protein
MGAVTMRLWVCPRCKDGCKAPSRPRRDDVRRYCLACSKATGRLVERVSPAIQHDKERRLEIKKERAARERAAKEKLKAAENSQYPDELNQLFDEWKRLPVWGARSGLVGLKFRLRPGMRTVVASTAKWFVDGMNYLDTLEFKAGTSRELAVDDLLYLMSHFVRGRRDAKQRALHHAAVELIVGHVVPQNERVAALAVYLDKREEQGG